MHRVASRCPSTPFSPRLQQTDTVTPHIRSERAIVSMPVLKAIKRMPWFPVAFSNFRFQTGGECVANAESTQERMVDDLYRRNQIAADLPQPEGNVARQLQRLQLATGIGKPRYQPTMQTMLDPGAEDIARLVREHGPVCITMACALGRNQGADKYIGHHALTVLCTFPFEGRTIALCLDGNDLQSGPLMDKLRAHADRLGVALDALTLLDLLNFQAELGDDEHAAQLIFRMFDLDSMVSASRAKQKTFENYQSQGGVPGDPGEPLPVTWPNAVRWARDAHVTKEPLPREALEELEAICRATPRIIEFYDAGRSSLTRDE